MAPWGPMVYSRWWQLKYVYVHFLFGEDEPILTFAYFAFFSDGLVNNHQAVNYPFWKCSRTVSFEKELKTSMNLFGSGSDWTSQPVSVFYYPCCAATYLDKMCFCRKWTAGNPKVEVDGRWLSFSSLDDFGVPAVHFQVCVPIALAQEFCFRDFWSSSCRSWSLISSCLAAEFMPNWTWHDFLLMKKLCSKALCSKLFFLQYRNWSNIAGFVVARFVVNH